MLFGARGQLGAELAVALPALGEVWALTRDEIGGDLADPVAMRTAISAWHPDVIVNAAAYTQVDRAESEPALAEAINSTAAAALATAASAAGALLVHYSTDYVFDGSGTRPWVEADLPAPLNTYGRSKRDGERAIVASGCAHLIIRVSWLFGAHGGNFLSTMLRLARERDHIGIVNDQIGTPTSTRLVAEATLAAIPAVLRDRALQGFYHLAPAGEASWFDYAALAIDTAREAGMPTAVNSLRPIPTSHYPTPAVRPLNSRLETTKLVSAFSLTLPNWQDDVVALARQLGQGQR